MAYIQPSLKQKGVVEEKKESISYVYHYIIVTYDYDKWKKHASFGNDICGVYTLWIPKN